MSYICAPCPMQLAFPNYYMVCVVSLVINCRSNFVIYTCHIYSVCHAVWSFLLLAMYLFEVLL